MSARVVEVRDALKARVSEWWGAAAPNEVRSPWRMDYRTAELVGRKVDIYPAEYASDNATRGAEQGDYRFLIVVAEVYPDPGDPPDDWIDERVAWCESLLNALDDRDAARLLPTDGEPYSGLWCELAAVTTVFDLEELTTRNFFFSVLDVTYREQA